MNNLIETSVMVSAAGTIELDSHDPQVTKPLLPGKRAFLVSDRLMVVDAQYKIIKRISPLGTSRCSNQIFDNDMFLAKKIVRETSMLAGVIPASRLC